MTGLPGLADHAFWDRILVDCPACGGVALVRPEDEARDWDNLAFGARRMTCPGCGEARRQARGAVSAPNMGLPLRLVGRGRQGDLRAWNEAHLDHIEADVRAQHRREAIAPGGPRNASVLSRLSRWVKAARNRDQVLKLIARMRARL